MVSDGAGAAPHRLCRDSIVAAALKLASDVGFETINIRAVASRLGCTPMALYRYVKGKDDLLGAMADSAIASVEIPPNPSDAAEDWVQWCVEAAILFWRMMRRYPGLDAYILMRGPVLPTSSAVRFSTQMIEVLLAAGFSPPTAARIWQTAHTYLTGHAMLARSDRPAGQGQPIVSASPIAEVLRVLAEPVDEHSLEVGLRHILGGYVR